MIYDVIIVGMGPGGIAASIYAKRSGLSVLTFESKMLGGLLNYTNVVNNYPGFINIAGPDLAYKMLEHFNTFEIEYKNENVSDIIDGDIKKVVTKNGEYLCKNVIIATGRSRRSLNLPGEKELMGHGISYCALCDGHFYKDKDVIVVGSGDSSLEEALYLAKICKKVTIVVELDDGSIVEGNGLFVYIGFDPILPFETDLGIEADKGYLIVDKDFETSVKGIYAIGDIIKKDLYQIISAEYEGASAATAISRKLTKKN